MVVLHDRKGERKQLKRRVKGLNNMTVFIFNIAPKYKAELLEYLVPYGTGVAETLDRTVTHVISPIAEGSNHSRFYAESNVRFSTYDKLFKDGIKNYRFSY